MFWRKKIREGEVKPKLFDVTIQWVRGGKPMEIKNLMQAKTDDDGGTWLILYYRDHSQKWIRSDHVKWIHLGPAKEVSENE